MNLGYGVNGKTKGLGYFTPTGSAASISKFFELFQLHNDVLLATANNYTNDFDFAGVSSGLEGSVPSDFVSVVSAWVWLENISSTGAGVSFSIDSYRIPVGETFAFSNSKSIVKDIPSTNSRYKLDLTSLLTENVPQPNEVLGFRVRNGGLTLRCLEGGVLYI